MTAIDFQRLLAEEVANALQEQAAAPLPNRHSRRHVDLDQFRLPAPMGSVHLIPEFIDPEEELALQDAIRSLEAEWVDLGWRRTLVLGGVPEMARGMMPDPPPCVAAVVECLCAAGVCAATDEPNHVLLNWYTADQGIAPHKEGPLYLDRVAILSLGKRVDRLDFWDRPPGTGTGTGAPAPVFGVRCPPRSLLLFSGPAYKDYWHGIVESELTAAEPEPFRMSLTLRRVLKIREAEVHCTEEGRREEQRRRTGSTRNSSGSRP